MQNDSICKNAENHLNNVSPQELEVLAESSFDYDTMYNFSPIRKNIVSWYDFGEDANILEIGGLTGAITECLIEKGNVTVLESSPNCRDILSKRFKNKNITIISSIEETDKKFDVITIIGSLRLYSDENESVFLSSLKNHLNENGRILIAVDNSLSIGKLSGRNEGLYFEKGYSKKELINIITTSNLGSPRFMYPAPDYRFTNVIFSDKELPNLETIKRRLTYCAEFHYASFDEGEFFSDLINENPKLYQELADSFLIEISTGEKKELPNMICYSLYRQPYCRIYTSIFDTKVTKKAVSSNSKNHVNKLKENITLLTKINPDTPDYIENDTYTSKINKNNTFDIYLSNLYKKEGKEALFNEVHNFFKYVSNICLNGSSENTIFDYFNIQIDNDTKNSFNFIKYGFIDMIFQNCFPENGKYCFFDQEWLFENVPIEFIMYRAITVCSSLDSHTKDSLLNYLHINDYCDLFTKLETEFNKTVHSDLFYNWFYTSSVSTTEYAKKLTDMYNKKTEHIEQLEKKNAELEECVSELTMIANESTFKHLGRKMRKKPALYKTVKTVFAPYNYTKCKIKTIHKKRKRSEIKKVLAFQKQHHFVNNPSFCAVFNVNENNYVNVKECIATVLDQTYPASKIAILDPNNLFARQSQHFIKKHQNIIYFGNNEINNYYNHISSSNYDYIVVLPSIPIKPDAFFNLANSINFHNEDVSFTESLYKGFPSISAITAYKKNYYLDFSQNNTKPSNKCTVFGTREYNGELTDKAIQNRKNARICAGMVLYNPDAKHSIASAENIISQVDMFFFSDNGSKNINEFIEHFKGNEKVKFILNDTNLGIAHALNDILYAASENNFDWVLTLDQDTLCDSNMINVYSRYIHDKSLGIISPFIIHRGSITIDEYKKLPLYESEYIPDFDKCITSASLTNVKAAVESGGFNDELFIDAVDFDLNQKLLMNNYKILKANDTYIVQEIGNRIPVKFFYYLYKITGLKKYKTILYYSVHSDFRLYYIARNYKWFLKKYKVTSPTVNKYSNFKDMFLRFLLYPKDRSRIQMFKTVRRGHKDARKMKY